MEKKGQVYIVFQYSRGRGPLTWTAAPASEAGGLVERLKNRGAIILRQTRVESEASDLCHDNPLASGDIGVDPVPCSLPPR